MFNFRVITLAAALAVSFAALAAAPVASAKGGPGVRVPGVCTKSSTAKLKLAREDSRIQVEFEVDQNRNGVHWKVTLRRNGSLVTSTTATTHAPSGSFSLHRLIPGAHGTVVAVATRSSGERCTAQARICAPAHLSLPTGRVGEQPTVRTSATCGAASSKADQDTRR
jgi:hypothetical protein